MYRSKFLSLLAALVVPLASQAAPTGYAYTAVGLTDSKSVALSISNSGNLTGRIISADGQQTKAFLYSHNGFIELGTLPGTSDGIGWDVNSSGQVVGESGRKPFLYSNGQMINLEEQITEARAINEAGHIAGWAFNHAILYLNGIVHDLGTLPGGTFSYATGVNNRGQVIGASNHADSNPCCSSEHAFLYDNGVMKDLGTLGGPVSYANGIDEFGHVAGVSYLDSSLNIHHAFLYSNGVMQDLGTVVQDSLSWANGINNQGQIVGWYNTGTGRSFIYDKHHGMRDLNRLVDPASGWFIHAGYSINERGQIAALGCKNGQYGAVLLTPTHRDGLVATTPIDDALPDEGTKGASENLACPYG